MEYQIIYWEKSPGETKMLENIFLSGCGAQGPD